MAFKKLKFWFDKELAILLADKIEAAEATPSFNRKAFIKTIDSSVQGLELKDRVEKIADALLEYTGPTFLKAIAVIPLIAGPENKLGTGMFSDFYWLMPSAKMIEKYGLEDFNESMQAIEIITKRNTSEYAIRPFIEKYPKHTMELMQKWSLDENFHLRRLACEGARPRLPWAKKLQQFIDDPKPLLAILNNLKSDPEKYVQKSVANCLNDLLKDNLQIAKPLIEQWNVKPSKETQWIIKHALRNLLKKDDVWAKSVLDL